MKSKCKHNENMYEWKLFIEKNRWKLLIAVILHIFITSVIIRETNMMEDHHEIIQFWLCSFNGNKEFIPSDTGKFELPITWIIFQAYILYLLCDYLTDNMDEFGIQGLIRSRNRKKWFFQKIKMSITVIIYYYIQYAVILGLGLMVDGNLFSAQQYFTGYTLKYVATIIVLPVVVTITIYLIQNMISLVYTPYVAYICSVTILVISSYWKNGLLIGNYAMFLRNELFRKGGLDSYCGLVICIIYGTLALGISIYFINRYDLLGKGLAEEWK